MKRRRRRMYRRPRRMYRKGRRLRRVGSRRSTVEVKYLDVVVPIQGVYTYFENQGTPTNTLQGVHNSYNNLFKQFYSGTNWNAMVGASVFVRKMTFKLYGYLCPQSGTALALTSLNTGVFRFIVHNANVTTGSSISGFFFSTAGQSWAQKPINRKAIGVHMDKVFTVHSPVTVGKSTGGYKFGDGRVFYKYYTLNVNRQIKFMSAPTAGSGLPRNESDYYSIAMLADSSYWADSGGGLTTSQNISTFCAGCSVRIYYTDD